MFKPFHLFTWLYITWVSRNRSEIHFLKSYMTHSHLPYSFTCPEQAVVDWGMVSNYWLDIETCYMGARKLGTPTLPTFRVIDPYYDWRLRAKR